VSQDGKSSVTSCAGFATSPLSGLRGGTLAVKPGSYFRRTAPNADGDAVDSGSAGCFCFSSKPATRVSFECEAVSRKTLAAKGWSSMFSAGQAVISKDNMTTRPLIPRVVILERHIEIMLQIRAMLLRSAARWGGTASSIKGTRSQVSQAAIAVVGSSSQSSLDLLSRCWEGQPKQILEDPAASDKVLSSMLLKVFALSTSAALSNYFHGYVSLDQQSHFSVEEIEGLRQEILATKKLTGLQLFPTPSPTTY